MDLRFLLQHHNTTKHLYKTEGTALSNNTCCANSQAIFRSHTLRVADAHERVTKTAEIFLLINF